MNAQELTIEMAKVQTTIQKNEEYINQRLLRANDDLTELKAALAEIQKQLHDLDKRIAALEKGSDLFWRLTPLALSVVAILVAFVKK